MQIPIQNIYYLLCYSWDKLSQREIVNLKGLDNLNMVNLFARVLSSVSGTLIRNGLDRSYLTKNEEIRGVKGKIDFSSSLKKLSFYQTKSVCEFDELDYNVLQNKILKTTIRNLLRTVDVEEIYKDKLHKIYRLLDFVDEVPLSKELFRKVRINKNNQIYHLLMSICELIYMNLLVDEKDGKYRFKDFTQDDTEMGYLFEGFVRNFYKKEQTEFKVRREDIRWYLHSEDENALEYLPKMQTDTTLESSQRKIIIDTKYSKNTFQINRGKKTIHSSHLYQMYAYLKNIKVKDGRILEGIILYPTVTQEVSFNYTFDDIQVKIRTVNLNRNWQDIHIQLLSILTE
ncbi:5-methylcytosine restriction system specificity protein McrC [Bacillus rhizoplanae]|uniref:5-methylcytosine restriction system specificity protein McrC n=1 Tax=Bacillus rhizoplanae TaxID=2880966 RepID=UPI003D24331A